MTQPTRIYKHSSAGTDWAALALGAGLGLTLALQLTTVRLSDFNTFYSVIVSISRLAALVGTYCAVVGMFLIARIPWVERGVGHDRLVTWHRKLGPWSLYLIGAHIHDPQTGMIAIGAKSASVVGSLGWLCDAMATAVMVGGTDSAKWFGQPELAGYQVFGVNRHEESAWEI